MLFLYRHGACRTEGRGMQANWDVQSLAEGVTWRRLLTFSLKNASVMRDALLTFF